MRYQANTCYLYHPHHASGLLDREAFHQDIDQEVRQIVVSALRALQYQHPHLYAAPPTPAQFNNNNSNVTNNY